MFDVKLVSEGLFTYLFLILGDKTYQEKYINYENYRQTLFMSNFKLLALWVEFFFFKQHNVFNTVLHILMFNITK